jgi:hypothetical protein
VIEMDFWIVWLACGFWDAISICISSVHLYCIIFLLQHYLIASIVDFCHACPGFWQIHVVS